MLTAPNQEWAIDFTSDVPRAAAGCLGSCAALGIFAFVDAALLKPIPCRDPAGLAGIYERVPLCERCNLSYADYFDWKRMNQTLASLDVYPGAGFSV